MANFSKTITNTLNIFGAGKASRWGEFIWGSDAWGSGEVVKTPLKLSQETLFLSGDNNQYQTIKNIAENITVTGDMSDEALIDPNGYYIVFQETANAENRPNTGYNSISQSVNSYTTLVTSQPTWVQN